MGDHPTFDAEELAHKRLELEALNERRYVMAADLEKRRRATLLAQKRQLEMRKQLEREALQVRTSPQPDDVEVDVLLVNHVIRLQPRVARGDAAFSHTGRGFFQNV